MRLVMGLLVIGCLLFGMSPTAAQDGMPFASSFDAEVAIAWFGFQLDLARNTPGFTPPVVSRAFGYTGVTLYEAIVPGMPDYQSLVGQLNGLWALPQPEANAGYNWGIVANTALYEITRQLYNNMSDGNKAAATVLYQQWNNRFGVGVDADTQDRSIAYGKAIAEEMLWWSMDDGGIDGQFTNFPATYEIPEGRGLWEPTARLYATPLPALQPFWGNNRTFTIGLNETCVLPAPPPYSEDPNSALYTEAMEVYTTVNDLTPEQDTIARFWADDAGTTATPPGHSIAVLNQILHLEGARLDFAAEAYAKLGMAVSDSFVSCWHYKYLYNLLRPVTYIHKVIDSTWDEFAVMPVVTPPFPEYPSGHSVQSGAAAVILTELFGEDYAFVDHTHDWLGFEPRAFDSFWALAEEAAISRLYGGIHFRSAIENGLELGKCVGQHVLAFRFLKTD